MTTQQQIAESQARLKQAASLGYDLYQAAKADHEELLAAHRKQEMAESGIVAGQPIYVVGQTYPHRALLKRLGLKWSAGYHAWVGTAEQLHGAALPAGCRITTHGQAALESMDHEHSIA